MGDLLSSIVGEGIGRERALKVAFGHGVLDQRVSSNGRPWRGEVLFGTRNSGRPARVPIPLKGNDCAKSFVFSVTNPQFLSFLQEMNGR